MEKTKSWIREAYEKVDDWAKDERVYIRFKNNLITKPIVGAGYSAGVSMALGSLTTKPGSFWDYVDGGFRGIYTFPARVINTLHGVQKVSEAGVEIHNDYLPVQECLEKTIKSAEDLKLIETGRNLLELRDTGGKLLDTLGKYEGRLEDAGGRFVENWIGLAQNGLENIAQHPYIALPVAAGFIIAGAAAGAYAASYVRKRFGIEKKTPGEKFVSKGKWVLEKTLAPAAYGSLIYGLAKDSMYSKFKVVKSGVEESYNALREQINEYSPLLISIGKRLELVYDRMIDSASGILTEVFGPNKISGFLESRPRTNAKVSGYFFEELGGLTLKTRELASAFGDSLEKVRELKRIPTEEAYWEFVDRAKEGIGRLPELVSGVDGLQERLNHPEELQNAIYVGLQNIASNLATYPKACLLAGLTAVAVARLPLATVSLFGNILHDIFYYKKRKKA